VKILYLSPMSIAGGGQRHAQVFSDGMREKGHDVEIVFTRIGHRGCMFHFLLRDRVVDDLCYRYDDPTYPGDMGRHIDTQQHDYLMVDNDERLPEIWAHSSRLQSGACKVVFVIHTENKPESQLRSLTGKIWKLICVSHKIADRFKWAHPVVIHNNVPRPASIGINVRQFMHIPADAFVIGYMGRLDGNKDPEFLLKIARDNDWWVLIVGKGPIAVPVSMTPRVRIFPNEVAMPGDWYSAMNVYVLPSRSEGFPLAPIEALKSLTSVAMTPTSDFPDVFNEFRSVRFFEHGNLIDAREKIESLEADHPLDNLQRHPSDCMVERYCEVMEI